jgi:Putative sensor
MTNVTTVSAAATPHFTLARSHTRGGPVARATRAAGRDLVYLTGVLGTSILGFVAWTVGLSLALSLSVLVIGALVWVAVAGGLRATVDLDRRLVGWYRGVAERSLPPPGRRHPHPPPEDHARRSAHVGRPSLARAQLGVRFRLRDRGPRRHRGGDFARRDAAVAVGDQRSAPPVRDAQPRYLHRHVDRLGTSHSRARSGARPDRAGNQRALARIHSRVAQRYLV